jgi:hypothetical protein
MIFPAPRGAVQGHGDMSELGRIRKSSPLDSPHNHCKSFTWLGSLVLVHTMEE